MKHFIALGALLLTSSAAPSLSGEVTLECRNNTWRVEKGLTRTRPNKIEENNVPKEPFYLTFDTEAKTATYEGLSFKVSEDPKFIKLWKIIGDERFQYRINRETLSFIGSYVNVMDVNESDEIGFIDIFSAGICVKAKPLTKSHI